MNSSSSPPPSPARPSRVNLRRPDVMEQVQAEVENHYRSQIVDKVRTRDGCLTIGNTTVRLAQAFGFCYGVERAIDLAYAARRVFSDREIYLIGEIIHNPEVNRQLQAMGIKNVDGPTPDKQIHELTAEDVVIVPAFGTTAELMTKLQERGCQVIDTTCGDVMTVWKRVRKYAEEGVTSIIHGKSYHEETKATASRSTGPDGRGHYLVVLDLEETDYVCRYIEHGGDREEFLRKFAHAHSEGFDPDRDLQRIGVANQTTMLKSETEEMQRRLGASVQRRDHGSTENFRLFETICGATQERQDALFKMLEHPMDLLLVVGGYNSSNTSQLVKIGGKHLPTFFIRDADCLHSLEEIVHYDLGRKHEVTSYSSALLGDGPATVGITAGASCPNNLIEQTILKIFSLRGIAPEIVAES
ncbi:MAG: 4-hydroxy-3-methylbut-2-enyl diphosphate reductase [Verrucomicrobia bacterium]|nr:4-hydroxy-3-methylbut-2-enyl diphosphate reductase [Verrucomicrobiota bacterium]